MITKFLGYSIETTRGHTFYQINIIKDRRVVHKIEAVNADDLQNELTEARFWIIERESNASD